MQQQQQIHDFGSFGPAAAAPAGPAGYSPFAGSSHSSSFLPPTPPRPQHPSTPQASPSLGRLGSQQQQHSMHASDAAAAGGLFHYGSGAGAAAAAAAAAPSGAHAGGFGGSSRASSSAFGGGYGSAAGTGSAGSPAPASPAPLSAALAAAELLQGGGSTAAIQAAAAADGAFGDHYQQQQHYRVGSASMSRQMSGMQQGGIGRMDSGGWGGFATLPAETLSPTGMPAAYHAGSPLPRAATISMQQLLQHQQQQQQAMARSFSLDGDIMAAAHAAQAAAGGMGLGYGGGGLQGAGVGRWGSGRLPQQQMDAGRYGADHGRLFGAVYDMKSLTAALSHVQAGTGDVRRMLASCTFRPRLPGLTKLVSQMSREGHWAKSLEVYESLSAVGVRPDTTITNAAISACDKGGQWEKALQLFKAMPDMGMERDAITYSALISALSKGRQWGMAIDVFNHMVAEGVECDAVTCCSLITALDKGGQWQLAEQVFIQMYQSHGQFHVLLEGMQQESPGGSAVNNPSPLAGTFTAEALSALSIQEEQLPPAELLQPLAPPGLFQNKAAAAAAGEGDGTASAGKRQRQFSPAAVAKYSRAAAALPAMQTVATSAGIQRQALFAMRHVCMEAQGVSAAAPGRHAVTTSSGTAGRAAAVVAAPVPIWAGSAMPLPSQSGSSSSSSGVTGHQGVTAASWQVPTSASLHAAESAALRACGSPPSSHADSSSLQEDADVAVLQADVVIPKPDHASSSQPDVAGPWPDLSGKQGSTSSSETDDQGSEGIIRTLSGAWSKIVGAKKAAAEAAAAAAASAKASSAKDAGAAAAAAAVPAAAAVGSLGPRSSTGSSSMSGICCVSVILPGSSDLLATSDAVVTFPGTAAKPSSRGAAADSTTSTAPLQQHQVTHSSSDSVLTRSLSAQLADMGLGPTPAALNASGSSNSSPTPPPPPSKDTSGTATASTSTVTTAAGTSAFAAEAATAVPAGDAAPAAAAAAPTGGSPSRPPVHPMRSGSGFAQQQFQQSPLRQGSLQRSGSIGMASPVGAVGLRLGRAGSLNSKKSSPNRVCCNALLAAYARAVPPRWKQALRLLEVMWQCRGELVPDIVSYNTVMKACGNAQQTDTAFELYHHMQQRGIEPTVATYGTLITIASEAQAYGRVKESWGWLQASGLPVHITCVNSYLTALIKEDNWDSAVELFQELKANRLSVRPNSVTYNILMSACLARDKPQTVKVLFDEMLSCSLSPSLISYNTLLHAYAKMGAWHESLALLQHLCTSSAVRPSTTSFNTVFCTLSNVAAAVGDMDRPTICSKALEVYALMLDQPGVTPDTTLYRNMVSTFAACQAHAVVLQLALVMAQQGHSLDPGTAAAALEALQAQHAWQHAGQLLRACYGVGTVVSQLVVQRLLLACVHEGSWKAAREILQVSAAAGQLEGIAQLLQQYRMQLQAAHASAGTLQFGNAAAQGLLPSETLDELLFLVFIQGQFATRGWRQALELFNVMKGDRGAGFTAGNAGVTAALLELLVCCGGTEGLLAAVQLVDAAHAAGTMGHYLMHPGTLGQTPAGSSAGATPTAHLGAAASSALLSPQQQLILQLEQATLGENSPQQGSAAAAAGGLFGLGGPASSFAGQLGLPGQEQQFAGSPASKMHMQGQVMPQPLTFVDVRGCSAAEAVVIVLSWLGQVVQLHASGLQLQCDAVRVFTGGWGVVSADELAGIVLHVPAPQLAGQPAATQEVASTAGTTAGAAEEEAGTTAAATAAPPAGAEAADGGGAQATAAEATAASVAAPPVDDAALSSISPHAAVLALLGGQLGPMVGCKNPMELLVPFSGGSKLALGLLCCSAVPVLLPDEQQGGGVLLSGQELQAAVTGALDASRT